jgi:hypothetical protein
MNKKPAGRLAGADELLDFDTRDVGSGRTEVEPRDHRLHAFRRTVQERFYPSVGEIARVTRDSQLDGFRPCRGPEGHSLHPTGDETATDHN